MLFLFILPYILLKTCKNVFIVFQEIYIFLYIFIQCPTIGQQNKQCIYHTALIAKVFEYVRSTYMAAREYSIPESTFRDRSLGIQPMYTVLRQGRAALLAHEEEKSLVYISYWLRLFSAILFGHIF